MGMGMGWGWGWDGNALVNTEGVPELLVDDVKASG